MATTIPVQMEFHISRQARDKYKFDQSIFSLSGNVIFANFHAARVFAKKFNARRDLVSFPEQAVQAGQINAMGLIDEILHMVVQRFREQRNPAVMADALAWLDEKNGRVNTDAVLRQFVDEFPPVAVYNREIGVDEYLDGSSRLEDGIEVPNRQIVLEELLMLWLANVNPAFSPFLELFNDESLEKNSEYLAIIDGVNQFFDTQPSFGPDNQNLVEMLRSPAVEVPHSLSGQLEYIRRRWGYLLGSYLYRLLTSLDLIKEEQKMAFLGSGQAKVYDFSSQEFEIERFTPDKVWMPSLVLIAKNIYVWLDQLSKKYQRAIDGLDQIPNEELDQLARWGFSGLWLIGLWERSAASKSIKQMRGNPDAVASAYSLFAYDIAADLGGEQAYQDLRDRAWERGIRLASDMVPNHMGIDSRWVIEHPNWFIQLTYSPFPAYTFHGSNLSWDERVGIFLEDHYYDNTDAAVVFKRVDFWSGEERFIYHGNDGTSMPWNDTAQLNYLLPEVREAAIQTILHVARKFPIIRFDAAMTLAKKHYQRLWYPEPGSGGDIPSRAEHGMTKSEFDRVFPVEFWREVVDRISQEAPDTLLLAEAFWLMEGFFVRTLGMHRVYNSAFMNMLRDEKNQEYRQVIKNTLEFEPEILKRYVNFMNNPDERTAVDQFGKGDKYFGICVLMATMPGLPMFGHGQVEGYSEKYGMEFRRAMWDEKPDEYLVERHEREIFPLLRRRHLFAEAKDFLLYDFYTSGGRVNEDVFAYSNCSGDEKALVIYHNRYAETRGWVRMSSAYPVKSLERDGRSLVRKSLGEGLGLSNDEGAFIIFRDQATGLEYIRRCRALHEQGMYIELDAYKYHIFLDFQQVTDDETHQYAQLAEYLNGRGVPNIEEALKEVLLSPIHTPFRELVNAGMLGWLIEHRATAQDETRRSTSLIAALDEAQGKAETLFREIKRHENGVGEPEKLALEIRSDLQATLGLLGFRRDGVTGQVFKHALDYLENGLGEDSPLSDENLSGWGTLLCWLFTRKLAKVVEGRGYPGLSRTWIDEWLLNKIIASTLENLGLDEAAAWRKVELVRILTSHQDWYEMLEPQEDAAYRLVHTWLEDSDIQRFLLFHRYQGILWFNKESFEELMWWMYAVSAVSILAAGLSGQVGESLDAAALQPLVDSYRFIGVLLEAEESSGFQVEKLLDAAKEGLAVT